MAGRLTVLLFTAVVIVGCGASPDTRAWDNGQFSFRYPAEWRVWEPEEPIELRRPTVLAYLGNVPVEVSSLCHVGSASAGCDFDAYGMKAGGVVVGIVRWSLPADGLPERGSKVTVGGRDARYTSEQTDRGTEMLTWTIAEQPSGGWLTVRGEIQGPNTDVLRRQVEDLIASLQFPPVASP